MKLTKPLVEKHNLKGFPFFESKFFPRKGRMAGQVQRFDHLAAGKLRLLGLRIVVNLCRRPPKWLASLVCPQNLGGGEWGVNLLSHGQHLGRWIMKVGRGLTNHEWAWQESGCVFA